MENKEQKELDKKVKVNAEAIRELAKSDSEEAEEFNKLKKSEPHLEDLRK